MDLEPIIACEPHEIYVGDCYGERSTVDILAHMPGSGICRELEPEKEDFEPKLRVFWYPKEGKERNFRMEGSSWSSGAGAAAGPDRDGPQQEQLPIEETMKSIFLEYRSYFNSESVLVDNDPEFGGYRVLAQFWAANKNHGGGLSTSDQPFGVYGLCNGVCRYRYKCMTITNVSDENKPVWKAFTERRIQHCPDIWLYSTLEFPLKEFATWSGFSYYLAIPLLKPEIDHHCIGVIEFLFWTLEIVLVEELIDVAEKFGLTVTMPNSHLKDMAQRKEEWDKAMVGETSLKELLDDVREELDLTLVQLWAPCNCSLPQPHLLCLLTSVDELHCIYSVDIENIETIPQVYFVMTGGGSCIGRAYSLNTISFCRDISFLDVSDYPAAPLTRSTSAEACFAVPMHLIYPQLPPSFILQLFLLPSFILQLFLPRYPYFIEFPISETAALLNSLLITLTHTLSTRYASFGLTQAQQFYIETCNRDPDYHGFRNFNVCRGEGNNTSVQNHETLEQQFPAADQDPPPSMGANDHNPTQATAEQQLLPSLDQPPTSEAANDHILEIAEEEEEETCTKSCTNKQIHITLDMITPFFGRKRRDAAQQLGVSESTLKRRCKDFGIGRWPSHPRNKVHPRLSTTSADNGGGVIQKSKIECSPNTNNNAREKQTAALNSIPATAKDKSNTVIVEATYRGDTAKFRFCSNFGLEQLREKLDQRFEFKEDERYKIKYRDEDGKWILMACDEDLLFHVETLKTLGQTKMELSISLVTN